MLRHKILAKVEAEAEPSQGNTALRIKHVKNYDLKQINWYVLYLFGSIKPMPSLQSFL